MHILTGLPVSAVSSAKARQASIAKWRGRKDGASEDGTAEDEMRVKPSRIRTSVSTDAEVLLVF